jgi:hypothetical protein
VAAAKVQDEVVEHRDGRGRRPRAAIASCGIHSGVASLPWETSLNSWDWSTSRTLKIASTTQKKLPAPWLQSSSARETFGPKRSRNRPTRMCSPRLRVWASARKAAAAIE